MKEALAEKSRENEELERELKEVADVLGDADEAVASYESLMDENEDLRHDLDEARDKLAGGLGEEVVDVDEAVASYAPILDDNATPR